MPNPSPSHPTLISQVWAGARQKSRGILMHTKGSQCFQTLAMHWNYLRSFRKHRCQAHLLPEILTQGLRTCHWCFQTFLR